MVTWTFDLAALVAGFIAGVAFGVLLFLFVEFRNGGAWSKGFYEGWDSKHDYQEQRHKKELNELKKEKKNETV